jgi:hypothetical protein
VSQLILREDIFIPLGILSIFQPETVVELVKFSEKVTSILSSLPFELLSNISISRTLGVASSIEFRVAVS